MAISNKVVKRYIVKRDLKSLFPKEFTGRELIGKFFDYVMNNFFEKSYERYVNGYIGRRTSTLEDGNFYLKEKDMERQLYQLTPMLIDTEKDSNNIVDMIDYSNFINTLKLQGCFTNDHNRLLCNEHWSYAPPINVDMFLNYNFYYWVEEGIKPIHIYKELQLLDGEQIETNTNVILNIIGKEKYDYKYFDENGDIKVIPFFNGMRVIFHNDDNIEYNEKTFIVEGVSEKIILINDDELFDPQNEDEADYFVMERGALDGNPWSLRNRWFNAEDIKRANLLNNTENDLRNYVQAKRPIICFNRDVELYNFGDYDRGWVDLITDVQKSSIQGTTITSEDGKLYIGNKGLETGAKIIFSNEPSEEDNNMIYELFLIDDADNKIATLYPVTNGKNVDGKPEIGECIKIKQSKDMCYHYNGHEWVLSQQKTKICQSPLFKLYDTNKDALNNKEIYPYSNFEGNTIFNYKEVTDKKVDIDEYLKRKVQINGYGNYIFDNTINSIDYKYKEGHDYKNIEGMRFYKINGKDEYKNIWHLSKDNITQYVMTEITVTDKREYKEGLTENGLPLYYEVFDIAYEPYKNDYKQNIFVYVNGNQLEKGNGFGEGTFYTETKDGKTKLYISLLTGLQVNDVIFVKILVDKVEKLADGYVFDLPLMLSSNALNEDVKEIQYNEMFDQIESILENQEGFEGLINGINNYKDTKKDLSLGTSIVQHSTPIVKTMLLNSKEYTNVRNVMTYTENEYTKFKNKFVTILDQMVDNGEYKQFDRNWIPTNPYDIVVKILNKLNVGKDGLAPFYNNGVAEQMINLDENSETYLPQPYIPSTPAYLGLDNCYKPEILEPDMDLSKRTLLCHDGSYESLMGDYRDNARLELEKQIYDSINSNFRDGLPILIKQKYIPGKFRTTDYSYNDYMKLYTPLFEKWCVTNGLDYEPNDTFDEANPFTWNWSSCYDKDGFQLPGSYRGIYLYYYDTDRPDTCPWEMLGFGSKPDWWENHYGTAPYTSENIPMWKDIENGYIADGNSQGYYECFKREGLIENYLPVDSEGNLLDPYTIGIATFKPTIYYASKPWKIGDMGYIENIWRHTSEYRYSMQTLIYLMKPLDWVEKSWNTLNTEILFPNTDYEQIINSDTNSRDPQTNITLHNELINGEYVKHLGSQQWFSDFLVSETIDITNYIGNYLRNMDIRLGYRCAGFYDKESIRVMSDNYGLIPTENYHLKLGEKKIPEVYSYSAFLIRKAGNHWIIDGYDYEHPYFEVLIPNKNGKKTPVEINGKNFTYYNEWSKESTLIRYKTEISTVQEVYNIICGYGKWLESKGFIFNLLDENGEQMDYRYEARKFLLWSNTTTITDTMVLQLNPMSSELNLYHNGFADRIGKFFNGFWTITDPQPLPIHNDELRVYRHNGYVTVNLYNTILSLCKITTSEKENILIFDNKTLYGDTLYNSLKGTKTERLRLIGIKANGWNGTYYAPGYVINNEETIVPDYDKLADDFNYVYDSDDIRSISKMGDEAKKTIGYHRTNYMQNLLIDDRNMFNFYKGMLKEKGTRLAFNKLNRSTHIQSEGSSNLNLDEHWAFNVGQFGYTKEKSTLELLVDAEKINHDPQIITYSTNPNYESVEASNIGFKWDDENWLKRNEIPDENSFKFKDYSKKMPTGGFAQLDDCDYIVDTKQKLIDNIDNLNNNDKVWVVKDNEYTWNMYKKIDDENNPLQSLKVYSLKELLAYNTLNLNKGDLLYVEKDCLSNWVSRLSDDETSNTINLYINDVNNLINDSSNITKKIAWSVFAYSGITPYAYVVSMPNGIIKVENNFVEYVMYVAEGLKLNMADGLDDDGNKKYFEHTVKESKAIEPYVESTETSDGNFTSEYGKFVDVNFSCTRSSKDYNSWMYVASIKLEKGTLPIIFEKDNSKNSFYQPGYFNASRYGLYIEKKDDEKNWDKLNSGVYVRTNQNTNSIKRWINAWGWDSPDMLQWDTVDGYNADNMGYLDAQKNHWNYDFVIKNIIDLITKKVVGYTYDDENAYNLMGKKIGHKEDDNAYYMDDSSIKIGYVIKLIRNGYKTIGYTYDDKNAYDYITNEKIGTVDENGYAINENNEIIGIVNQNNTHYTTQTNRYSFVIEDYDGEQNSRLIIKDENDDIKLDLIQYHGEEPERDVYKYVIIDENDVIYKVKYFDFVKSIEPQKNDFYYDEEEHIFYCYNGAFWQKGGSKAYCWGNGFTEGTTYYTIDEKPIPNQTKLYIYRNDADDWEISEETISRFDTPKYAWIYSGRVYYTDSSSPVVGDKVYKLVNDTDWEVFDIVSSYYEGADYLYCDSNKYIRDIDDDRTNGILVNGEILYYNENNSIDFPHYALLANVSIEKSVLPDGNSEYNLTDIKVYNPYDLVRIEQKPIDNDIINTVKLVDNDNSMTLATLNKFDPLYGVLPEKVINEVDYITSYDPVDYSNPNKWYDKVGRLWWNTAKVRYLDYYQGDLKYRRDNWGKQLPGSEIAIMEWTKSTILPDDAENYLTEEVYNTRTEKNDIYYYFWVLNPSIVPEFDFRTTSAYDISRKINSPQDEGMLWFAPIKLTNKNYDESSFIIGNFDDVTVSNDFVVQINFKNRNEVYDHNEWLMIVEDSEDKIPDLLWNKMKYSLIGKMTYINDEGEEETVNVPDITLPERDRYGISIRPRQTMFVDLIKARRNFVDAVNDVLSSRDIRYASSDDFSIFRSKDLDYGFEISETFSSHDEMLLNTDKSLIGKYVLVSQDEYYDNIWTVWYMSDIEDYKLKNYQKYNMESFSYFTDAFLNKDYNENTYNYRVKLTPNYDELIKLINKGIPNGSIIRLDDPETLDWIEIVQYDAYTRTIFLVGIRNGYVQISDDLYTYMENPDNSEFIDGLTKYEYVNNEVEKCIEIICDYFDKN